MHIIENFDWQKISKKYESLIYKTMEKFLMLTFDFNKINLPPGAKVLDVGCGEGRHIFGILNEFKDVYCFGLDQDIPSLEKCKEGLEFFKELDSNGTIFQQGSVYQLPFKDHFLIL